MLKKLFVFTVACFSLVLSFRCDRRPYGTTSPASASDGRFQLVVEEAEDNYIPDQLYVVKITETDGESRFSGFMVSAEGDIKPDPRNPRRYISLSPGELRPQNSMTAKYSERCPYSVEHAMASTKSFVKVYWQAPPPNSGCVTLHAMVSETQDIWFDSGAPLSQRLCEDMRQSDDVTPQLNYNCNICDEAKYEVCFTGIWSRNTHPLLYPENDWLPFYSDLIGASHSSEYILWAPGSFASSGFRELAEHADGSKMEAEIREKIGDGVRTLIKGKGHGYRKMGNPTYAFFRTDRVNHLFTVAVGFQPSPDWFLGVTRFELCQQNNTWMTERTLNLYPWDAGTDSGVSYESPNLETFPQDTISRVQMSTYDKKSPFYEMDIKDLNPFGKLHIRLIRTYHRRCKDDDDTKPEETTTTEEPTTTEENPLEPYEPSRYRSNDTTREVPLVTDPEADQDCPISQWQEWSPCDGSCDGGRLSGYRWRERYHLVDGVAVEKYDPNIDPTTLKEVPQYCKEHYDDFERNECEEECSDSNDGIDDFKRK
ncbi:f-spondin [Danaus plexippus plexippus]|uniref:F-spondin n=1 Tax=Danaus plexippus plexippus TaxID=278856 RepID=A0A212EH32_DANPL|nr:f-spondin [Danaus plexippus plexippus]